MGSRREEERNEKIIRGLMKLPPNRKCINCNSLGPQYVCTNFWTFVCMTCSGIHREFTHRVKSVSMSKFTSQEVEALQSGGNQRAKEIYLKIWDFQSQRFPSSSNVDKIREFIKSVYVDKRYAGGNTSDKPPRDVQTDRSFDDERKRASSYHSYSQSPPYDYQYEYHRNGKPVATLSRKPGSDKGYVGRISSFFRSPRRSSEMSEDKFANEGSSSRLSDYSVSSGGDQLRSDRESPNCQDTGQGSPSLPSRDISVGDIRQHTIRRPQRTASSGSFASFDSNSVSLKSYNSANLADLLSEGEQAAGNNQDRMSMFQQVSATKTSAGSNLHKTPEVSAINPSAATSMHSSEPALSTQTPSLNLFQPEAGPSSTMDLFAEFGQQQPTAPSSKELLTSSALKNEGWATFDPPQPAGSIPVVENSYPASIFSSNPDTSVKDDSSWSTKGGLPWPPYQVPEVHDLSSSLTDPWTDKSPNTHLVATNTQSWSTFEEPLENHYSEGTRQPYYPSWNALDESTEGPASNHTGQGSNPPVKEITKDAIQSMPVYDQPSHPSFPLDFTILADSVHPLGEICSHAADKKSINPFDLPSDSEFYTSSMPHGIDGLSLNSPVETRLRADDHEQTPTNPFDVPFDSNMEKSNMFLDMSSMQAALPDAKLPPFVGGDSQAWFHQNSLSPYIPSMPDGGLAFMASQAPGPQLH